MNRQLPPTAWIVLDVRLQIVQQCLARGATVGHGHFGHIDDHPLGGVVLDKGFESLIGLGGSRERIGGLQEDELTEGIG